MSSPMGSTLMWPASSAFLLEGFLKSEVYASKSAIIDELREQL